MSSVMHKARLFGLKLDKKRLTKDMDNQLQINVRQSARAWLRAMIEFVPVWTGMTRGSIKFAQGLNGDLATYLNVSIPITPDPNARVTPYQNEEVGGTLGRYAFTNQRKIYGFYFRSDVVQFFYNEFFDSISPTSPWDSLVVGAVAYKAEMAFLLLKMPKVKKYVSRSGRSSGGEQVGRAEAL